VTTPTNTQPDNLLTIAALEARRVADLKICVEILDGLNDQTEVGDYFDMAIASIRAAFPEIG